MIKGADMEQATTSLHETLTSNFDKIVTDDPQIEAPKVDVPKEETKVETKTEVTEVTKDRPRDETGKFLPKDKVEAKPEKVEKPEVSAVTQATYKAPSRPSTWKKELETHWGTLPKEVHEEILRREQDFAKGVSTYKTEYERVKPIAEALKPYESYVQQAGGADKFIHALAGTHQVLTQGSQEDKLRAFAQFAQDYQIPLHQLLVQGEDGKIYLNQNYFGQKQQQNAGITPQQVQQLVQQQLQQVQVQTAIQQFAAAKDKDGNPLYPHFEKQEVRESMDGLLRAGVAQDLPTAYEYALALPKHSHIREADAEQRKQAEDLEKQRVARETAERAKRNQTSTKSNAPTSLVQTGGPAKGLRAMLEENADAFLTGSRV